MFQKQQHKIQKSTTSVIEKNDGIYSKLKSALPAIQAVSGSPQYSKQLLMQTSLLIQDKPKLAAVLTSDLGKRNLFGCLLSMASLRLSPDPTLNQCALVPFKTTIKLIFHYKAIISIARKQGIIINVQSYHEGDIFDLDLGANTITHKPKLQDQGLMIGFYGVSRDLKNGIISNIIYVERKKLEAHRDRWDNDKDYTPWKSNFESMCKKTVARRVADYAGIDFNPCDFETIPEAKELLGAKMVVQDEEVRFVEEVEEIEEVEEVSS